MRLLFWGVIGLLAFSSAACAESGETAAAVAAAAQDAPDPALEGETIESAPRVAPRSMAEMHLSFAPVVERAAPAVVNIYTRRVVNRSTGDPFFDRFFGMGPREQTSLGSGVIVSPDGVIVTNNHVIENMTEIKVVLADRREFEAQVLLADSKTDLAVLKIEAGEPLPFLEFANSDAVEVGDIVLAIGNPFGVGQTVTSGIISALARTGVSITDYQFFIQTDAAINPGNSGGALVDVNGRLVGVNTAIYSRTGGSHGIGFAIPSALVQQVIRSAVTGGELVRPWLGAAADTVTADIARAIGLDRPAGAIITEIWPGGPADRAGLKVGDVVTEIDGEPVYDAATLRYRVGVRSDGETATVVYRRDGRERTARVALALPPDEPARDPRTLAGPHPLDGVTVDNLSPRFNEEVGLDPFRAGVVVAEVNPRSFAARRGLRRGYRILSVNGRKVRTSAELEREINRPARRWDIEVDTGRRIVTWTVGR
ncbi:DegQ family serine endoprotease [Amphiplicatus metriothermophilus]|uniref:Do/DeqQ family serine protease n=1 Tax=Amphiplicatus metriothermophilus TaxID=1519374 RepID=A0A239PQE8_9PROT|nr:DegQ family serine endoprotease [Amphiplicatus metriothermophilus]MBB5518489.1 Do/DeqQ family serine protease [Amphiplicatus metriothermophilus]SNT72350.1 Do/DeqQ family serine protease [Amphiplicatus metriothermophilus]